MRYEPKDASNAIPAGTYESTILRVEDQDNFGNPLRSKKGEDMERVVFEVYTENGTRTYSQLFTAKSMLWLYRKLAKAIGQGDAFAAGTFQAGSHIGASLRLKLTVEDSPEYGEQNRVEEFMEAERRSAPAAKAAKPPARASAAKAPPPEDDPPF